MADFEFTSPEGKKYRITGPEGATAAQAYSLLQAQLGPRSTPGAPSAPAAAPAASNAAGIASPPEAQQEASDMKAWAAQVAAQPKYTAPQGWQQYGSTSADSPEWGRMLLTQGGRLDPNTAQSMLLGDLEALFGSAAAGEAAPTEGIMKALGLAGKGVGAVAKGIGKGATAVGSGAAEIIGKLFTHTGAEPIKEAARVGYQGGEAQKLFTEALRNISDPREAVSLAKKGLAKLREARSAAYRSGMVDIKDDAKILSLGPVDAVLSGLMKDTEFEGTVVNPGASAILKEAKSVVDEWRAGDPSKFLTVEGMDALKRRLGSLVEKAEPHTEASRAAGVAYNAVKDTISQQAPAYGKVMQDYEAASDAIRQFESAFSLKDFASRKNTVDQALGRLQSVMRNNVYSNYGARLNLARELDKATDGKIMPMLAGQAMSSWLPRGLGGLGAQAGALMAAGGTASGAIAPTAGHIAGELALAGAASPRIVGETAMAMGRGARNVSNVYDYLGAPGTQRLLSDLGITGRTATMEPPPSNGGAQ